MKAIGTDTRELGWRGDWLVNQLPVGMVDDSFLVRFVTIIQTVANGMLDHLDDMPHLADVAVTPERMVPYLGSWVGLDWVEPDLAPRVQREIVRRYAKDLTWRGTGRGIKNLLTTITGDPEPKVSDSGGVFEEDQATGKPPHVDLEVSTLGAWATEADLVRIVRSELPASVTFELKVHGKRVDQRRAVR